MEFPDFFDDPDALVAGNGSQPGAHQGRLPRTSRTRIENGGVCLGSRPQEASCGWADRPQLHHRPQGFIGYRVLAQCRRESRRNRRHNRSQPRGPSKHVSLFDSVGAVEPSVGAGKQPIDHLAELGFGRRHNVSLQPSRIVDV
jgi:hypothetical protein